MGRRRGIGAVPIVVPVDPVLAVRSSARMSRDGISDDYEGYRHKGRDYEDMARRRAAEMADLDALLGQLGDSEEQARRVTADYCRCRRLDGLGRRRDGVGRRGGLDGLRRLIAAVDRIWRDRVRVVDRDWRHLGVVDGLGVHRHTGVRVVVVAGGRPDVEGQFRFAAGVEVGIGRLSGAVCSGVAMPSWPWSASWATATLGGTAEPRTSATVSTAACSRREKTCRARRPAVESCAVTNAIALPSFQLIGLLTQRNALAPVTEFGTTATPPAASVTAKTSTGAPGALGG